MKERGKLLVLEGGVGSGKSTQQSLLREQLSDWQFYNSIQENPAPYGAGMN